MGAYKEGFRSHERLRVSSRKELSESVVFTEPAHRAENHAEDNLLYNKLASSTGAVRMLGDSNLSLAYVAAGKADAFVAKCQQENDLTAGIMLVKEAGGYVFDINQKDIRTEDLSAVIASGNIIAVNANLNNKVYDLLNR